jgi:hypothetical protein
VSLTQLDRVPIRRALISVYDKTGLEELAKGLHAAGVKIVSTGSTAKKIAAAGIPVQEVEEVTGSPEMLDGRVKTCTRASTAASSPTAASLPTWRPSPRWRSKPSTSSW